MIHVRTLPIVVPRLVQDVLQRLQFGVSMSVIVVASSNHTLTFGSAVITCLTYIMPAEKGSKINPVSHVRKAATNIEIAAGAPRWPVLAEPLKVEGTDLLLLQNLIFVSCRSMFVIS